MKLKEHVKLKPHQEDGVNYALNNKYVINADEMGLGKSVQSIVASMLLGGRTLVVCPANLRLNWVKEINKFVEGANIGACLTKKDFKKLTLKEDFIIVSYSLLGEAIWLFELCENWIIDEAHKLKNPRSKRTKVFLDYSAINSRPKSIQFLTGTPIANRVADFYTLIYICSFNPEITGIDIKDKFRGFEHFRYYFSQVTKRTIKVRGRMKEVNIYGRLRKDRTEKLRELLKGKFIRRLAKDHLDLDEIQRKEVQITDSINKELEVLIAELEGQGKPKPSSMSLKERNAYEKAEHTIKYVEQLLEEAEDEQILIYSDHVGSAQKIAKTLLLRKHTVGVITGLTTEKARERYVDNFTTGKLNILVATIGTSSTGYTFTNCRHVVFNDYSFNPSDNWQAEKRIHRIGQERQCYSHWILGDASDLRILELVNEKQEDINHIFKEQ